MSKLPDVLWLNTSSSFQCFDRPLLRYLSMQVTIAQWEYVQSQDKASLLDVAVLLLHDYLKSNDQPVHLIGHSTGGLLATVCPSTSRKSAVFNTRCGRSSSS